MKIFFKDYTKPTKKKNSTFAAFEIAVKYFDLFNDHMKKIKITFGLIAILAAALAVFFVLNHEKTLVTHPKGFIAESELKLIGINYLLMMIVTVPTLIALFVVAMRYNAKNKNAKYDPEHTSSKFGEAVLWIIPSLVIAVMA